MKKHVLKVFSVLIVSSLFIGCSGSGVQGDSNVKSPITDTPGILKGQIGKEKAELLKESGLNDPKRVYYAPPKLEKGKYDIIIDAKNPDGVIQKVVFDEDLTSDLTNISYVGINEDSYVEFKPNNAKIPKIKSIQNRGNMYFVDYLEKPIEYVIDVKEMFYNAGEIFVIDGNQGSVLKIDGNYHGPGVINLGLYIDETNKKITTDKVHITGNGSHYYDATEVRFVYNEEVTNKFKDAKTMENDYVIKVGGNLEAYNQTDRENKFFVKPRYVPHGNQVYELNYYPKKTDDKASSHVWKLETKK